MKYFTILSIILWLCTILYLVTVSTIYKTPTQTTHDEAITADKQVTIERHRSRRSASCSCSGCVKKNTAVLKLPTRIPFGSPRKVITFLKMVHRGMRITYRRKGLMYCKNGYLLKISKDGTVVGTTQHMDRYTKLEFQSVGMGLVRIKGVMSERYLAIDQHGTLYSTNVFNKDCIFEERQEENLYHSFTSHRYRKPGWYIALRRNGQAKKTTVLQKATQFLVLFS